MVSDKSYYKLLYEKLIAMNQNMFSECDEKEISNVVIKDGCFDWLYELLNQVEEKYEFDMQKMLLPNYKKFVLWQEHYLGKIDVSRIEIATEFIVFCCLIDKILDSRRFTDIEKEFVCEKIMSNNLYSTQNFESDNFTEIDALLNNIRKFIINTKCSEVEKEKLKITIDKALLSEVYMYRYPLKEYDAICKQDYHYLIDKSIEFEKAAFMLATYGNNIDKTEMAAVNVGNVFWIIDDLCDLMEDVRYRRRNSLLFIGIDSEEPIYISNRIDYVCNNMELFIGKIISNLNELKINAGDDFYKYIMNEVWEWCRGVRRMSQ